MTWRTWSPCVSVAAERHATSAPPRRTLMRPAIQAAVEDGPGATGSAGHPSPRQGTPGLWTRTPAWSGCGNPRGTPRAIGQPTSHLRSRRCPRRSPGRIRPPSPPCSTTPRAWRGQPGPGRHRCPGIRDLRRTPLEIRPWAMRPRRRDPRDALDQADSTPRATVSTCPSSWVSTRRWGWTPSCVTLTAWTTPRTL